MVDVGGLISAGPLLDADRALEERLLAAFPAKQFQHDVVPPKLDKRAWDKLTRRTPFIGRGFNDWTAAPECGRLFRGPTSWTVMLITRHQNGMVPLFRGDTLGPGLLGLAQVAMAVLHGFTVRGVGTFFVQSAANSYGEDWSDENAGMMTLELQLAGLELTDPAALDQLDDFLRLGVTWDSPPIAEQVQTVRES